jgi:TRAP-type mannitol/chloroaromatic compound transport system permease small subunit
LVVGFDVISRKLFNFTAVWIMDVEWHLFALIFLLASGYALRYEKHVRVDLYYAAFSKRDKALVDFWGTLLFLIPWCIVALIHSFDYAMESLLMNEGAAEPGGLPARYVIKFGIGLGIFLLFLQAIALLIHAALTLWGKDEQQLEETSNIH